MNKSQRIKINPLENINNHIKVKLEQNVDTLEFLSMSIDTSEVYQDFNADYGVLIGRVIANDGIGIPNAKISIFVPLEEADENNSDIVSIYPYKSPRDKNLQGKRYNLLPRVGQFNPDGTVSPKQPFGSFPIKAELVTNQKFLNVYKKYYKYTALTNNSGDYMIFGVPVGTQTVHLSVDITDIGEYSMTPAAMVTNLGYSPNLFTDNNSRIKPTNDLNDLPHIETQEITVDVIPFWGNSEIFEIGITRQDFRIRATLTNTFVIFGSVFTDGSNHMWGHADGGRGDIRDFYRARNGEHLLMTSKRTGRVTEAIYYYPTDMTDDEIVNAPNTDPNGNNLIRLDPTQYSVFKRDGDFVFIISCNRRKVITDELGNPVVVPNDNPAGVFTEFKGFITLEYATDDLPMDFQGSIGTGNRARPLYPIRFKVKIPQEADRSKTFAIFKPNTTNASENTAKWRHQHMTFTGGKIYSVAKFHGLVSNTEDDNSEQAYTNGFMKSDKINQIASIGLERNTGIILSEILDIGGDDDNDDSTPIKIEELPSNAISVSNDKVFGANWLNFAIHLPQFGRINVTTDSTRLRSTKSSSNFTIDFRRADDKGFPSNRTYYRTNNQLLVAGELNTRWFARSDLHWTAFVETPKDILVDLKDQTEGENFRKGFKQTNLSIDLRNKIDAMTTNKFKNGQTGCPLNGGKVGGNPTAGVDTNIYFYKGWDTANCLEFLFSLNIV